MTLAIAPSGLADLQDAIEARMREVAAEMPLLPVRPRDQAATAALPDARPAEVFPMWLPPKDGPDQQQYPFIIVRPRTGQDDAQGKDQASSATWDIILGTYSDDGAGFKDALLLCDRIRLSLHGQPVLGRSAFEHVGPLTWELRQNENRPHWLLVATTVWTLPRPLRVDARDRDRSMEA